MDNSRLRYVNMDYLNLMSANDPEMKKVLLGMLLEEMPGELRKMSNLFKGKDWKRLAEVSHKMKSTLAFAGNDEMTNANLFILERSRTATSLEKLSTALEVLNKKWPLVQKELKAVYDSISK